jgi:Mg-chelatase subunit ChlD
MIGKRPARYLETSSTKKEVQMSEPVQLNDRDFILIIDSSGSMATNDQKGGQSRWNSAAETTVALAAKAMRYDPDGLTLYTFSQRSKRFDNIGSAARISQVFEEVEPNGSTNLDGVLSEVFKDYLARKKKGETKPNGEIMVVITDGQPDDPQAAKKCIEGFTQNLEKDSDYGILFVQVGNDQGARAFLKQLDDGLKGAKFDIVDTLSMDEIGDRTISEALAGAIAD